MSGNFLLRVLAAMAVTAAAAPAAATIVIVNVDGANEGFNDPTPATPVGGNAGTTLGEQRLIAFQYAAAIWGAKVDSAVEIRVQASFDPLPCNVTGAVLGSAGPVLIASDFPGIEYAQTWYHIALANKLAGADLVPGPAGTAADDIRARFNANLGTAGCLPTAPWYFGLNTNTPPGQINLVTVLLHEFAHGLGFSAFVDPATGETPLNQTDVYSRNLYDATAAKPWNEMTNAERQASAINTRKVHWSGFNVTHAVPKVLRPGTPFLQIYSPASIAGSYLVGGANFGTPPTTAGFNNAIVLALDAANAAGPLTTDACSPIQNVAAIAGRIALIDRGTCAFTVKVKNAQNAGAFGVIIADNAAGSPPPALAGDDPSILIPSVRITLEDANIIKAQLPTGVTGALFLDLDVRLGATRQDHALLFTPNPVQPGSSVSHWDSSAFPHQLMEPAINAGLTHSLVPPLDLTLSLMRDLGWFSDADGVPDARDHCPGSSMEALLTIRGCPTGVPNLTGANGCRVSDLVTACATNATSYANYRGCVMDIADGLRTNGIIGNAQHAAMQTCAARVILP